MNKRERELLLEQFGLRDGQFFGSFQFKNLHWQIVDPESGSLSGHRIGYGDLTLNNIAQIRENLSVGEFFLGWNEHHGSDWQQLPHPIVIITDVGVHGLAEIRTFFERGQRWVDWTGETVGG